MKLFTLLAATSLSLSIGSTVLAQTSSTSPSTATAPAAKPHGVMGMFKRSKPAAASVASPSPASTASTTPTTTQAGGKQRSAVSLACSSQADAKGLHGNDRRKFVDAGVKLPRTAV